jgi:hypothetical protein
MKRYSLSLCQFIRSFQKLLNGLQQDLLLEYTVKVSVEIYFLSLSMQEPLVYRELKSKLAIFYKKQLA